MKLFTTVTTFMINVSIRTVQMFFIRVAIVDYNERAIRIPASDRGLGVRAGS